MTMYEDPHGLSLYALLSEHFGDEGAQLVMRRLPPTDWDKYITGDQLAARIADLRSEMHAEFAAQRVATSDGFAEAERRTNDLRTDMTTGFAHAAGQREALEVNLHKTLRNHLIGLCSLMVGLSGLIIALPR